MRRITWLVSVVALVASCGCGAMLGTSQSHGKRIDREKLAQVEKGKTTMAEVEKLLGKPQAKESKSDGTVWTYEFLKASAFSGSESEGVQITFDAREIVSDITESSWKY